MKLTKKLYESINEFVEKQIVIPEGTDNIEVGYYPQRKGAKQHGVSYNKGPYSLKIVLFSGGDLANKYAKKMSTRANIPVKFYEGKF